jgi:hypothetical protein
LRDKFATESAGKYRCLKTVEQRAGADSFGFGFETVHIRGRSGNTLYNARLIVAAHDGHSEIRQTASRYLGLFSA